MRMARASATPSRMRGGTLSSPRPGSNISMVPMRANTKRNAAASAGRKEMSTLIPGSPRSPRHDPGHDPCPVGGHRVGHERQRDQHRDEDGDDLGNEDQRGFLDLGERLEQRNDHAD